MGLGGHEGTYLGRQQGWRRARSEGSGDKAAPASPGAQVRAKLEGEAQKIRQDKGYWECSAPSHRALQSRMSEIMGELHGVG